MEEDEERVLHPSVQAAVDYAIGRLKRGIETTVYLTGVTQAVQFKPPEKKVPVQRIGDNLRDLYLDRLRLAYAQGFITKPEFDQRAAAALAAVTRAELEPVTQDLQGVEREQEEKPEPHRHKTCVDLPIVVMLVALAVFVTMLVVNLI